MIRVIRGPTPSQLSPVIPFDADVVFTSARPRRPPEKHSIQNSAGLPARQRREDIDLSSPSIG